MANTTRIIIQISSFFILLTPFRVVRLQVAHLVAGFQASGFLDDNHLLGVGPPDLLFRGSGHFSFETKGPHHHDAHDPPGYLPGPDGGKAAERKGLVGQDTSWADGEEVPQRYGHLHFFTPGLTGRTRLVYAVEPCPDFSLAFSRLWFVLEAETAAEIGHDETHGDTPESRMHGERLGNDFICDKNRDHGRNHAQDRTDGRKAKSPEAA